MGFQSFPGLYLFHVSLTFTSLSFKRSIENKFDDFYVIFFKGTLKRYDLSRSYFKTWPLRAYDISLTSFLWQDIITKNQTVNQSLSQF